MRDKIKSLFGIKESPTYLRVVFKRDGDGWKSDHTYEEVLAAYRNGAHIEAEVPSEAPYEEINIVPLAFATPHPTFKAVTFFWQRTFVPSGGYGDVTVYSIEARLQPNSAWVDYTEEKFPSCTCGRDPVPV